MSIVLDAAQPLSEVEKGLAALDVPTGGLMVQFDDRRRVVVVRLVGAAARNAETVWELLILEFRHAGWGFTTRFDNGIDQPRTHMRFDHPITLTRF